MAIVGYARVSTQDQDLSEQLSYILGFPADTAETIRRDIASFRKSCRSTHWSSSV
jgi:hypothetical protein